MNHGLLEYLRREWWRSLTEAAIEISREIAFTNLGMGYLKWSVFALSPNEMRIKKRPFGAKFPKSPRRVCEKALRPNRDHPTS